MEYKDPGRYIPVMYLLYSWGSRFGVPSRVPLVVPRLMRRAFLVESTRTTAAGSSWLRIRGLGFRVPSRGLFLLGFLGGIGRNCGRRNVPKLPGFS